MTNETSCCIHILNSNFEHIGSFGNIGSGEGEFDNPQHLACDSTGNVHVADYNNQAFSAEGVFLTEFGEHGRGRGELRGPNDIAIDSDDRVYVSEYSNNRISVFTSGGLL